MANIEDVLSTAEVAEELGVSIRTVHRLAALGHIHATKLPGSKGAWIFDPEAVRLFKEQERAKRSAGAAA